MYNVCYCFQWQKPYCCPGKVYGVDVDISNTGIAFADTFVIHEHWRYTQNICIKKIHLMIKLFPD